MHELRTALAAELDRTRALLDALARQADGMQRVGELAALLVWAQEVNALVEVELEGLADAVPVVVPAG